MQFRPVLLALGIMTGLLGFAMLPSALIDLLTGNADWVVFASTSFVSMLSGICIRIMAYEPNLRTGQREAFLLTVLVWVVLPLVAAVPFLGIGLNFTDAMFESISGLTTTGATILTDLDTLPPGLLLWRAVLQWIGGIGIIVTAIAILPSLRVGGMQLFQIESSDQSGKFLPRVTEIAVQTGAVYLVGSLACAAAYSLSGLTLFDSVTHAMTTMSAGGFSTRDESFAAFAGTPAPLVATFFMIIAGLPFSLLVLALFQGRPLDLFRDPQPRLFLALVLGMASLITAYHAFALAPETVVGRPEGFDQALFNIVSITTGTGYASAPYDTWGPPVVMLFLVACFLGGCAGSAACGIKMFRLEISAKAVFAHAQRVVRPHRLAPVRYNGHAVDEDTLQSVMVFVFLYVASFMVGAALLGVTGEDAITAISAAAASVSNVGPGLGEVVGPQGTYQPLTDMGKWICALLMLLGRLEFVAVFVVLSRRFWFA